MAAEGPQGAEPPRPAADAAAGHATGGKRRQLAEAMADGIAWAEAHRFALRWAALAVAAGAARAACHYRWHSECLAAHGNGSQQFTQCRAQEAWPSCYELGTRPAGGGTARWQVWAPGLGAGIDAGHGALACPCVSVALALLPPSSPLPHSISELPPRMLAPDARPLPVVLHSVATEGPLVHIAAAHYPPLHGLVDFCRG